ncbi:MAG: LacI family DNA-binding transcriptional regulator [Candidatus Sumerlaeia bacterium]|nr:LacI family DNA-binding transcriptional regulator [Candidatus Sumerlaeia bacterium]
MAQKPPTIYQIAELAGVSIGTVSRVMNGKDRVAPATRARVLAVAEKYDFRPNAAARGLATNRTHALMMLVSDLANVYFAEMAKRISRHARDAGLRTVLADSDETPEREAEYLRALADGHVDGAVIAPLTTDANIPLYQALIRRRFPLVLMDTELEGVDASCVRTDNERGAALAVDYLAEKGHARIGFVCGNIAFQTNRLRFQGFREALQRRGLPLANEHLVFNQDFLEAEGFCGVDSMLAPPNRPTAIFASTDLTAMGCVRTIRRAGLRVPDDIAVVGFDDLRISAHMEVPLTTIGQPKDEIAATAVELLAEQLDPDASPRGRKLVRITPVLVRRASA